MSTKSVYEQYVSEINFSGELEQDVKSLLEVHHEHETYEHIMNVVREAIWIAKQFGIDEDKAYQAALFHDISNIIPKQLMLSIAQQRLIDILPDERTYPRIVHQKLSRDMANILFHCTDSAILAAIECHTTLKPGASTLAKVLFAADKVSWELHGEHPYQDEMRLKLESLDLDGAVLVYLNHVWSQRDKLKFVHPWLIEARQELLLACANNTRN